MANYAALDGGLNLQQVAAMADMDAQTAFILIRSSEHRKPTFWYSGNYTPVAAPTDSLMIQGSATRTLRVKRISLLGATGTAAGTIPATLIRRTTQFTTQGTAAFTNITPGKADVNDANATGVVATIGTANITSLGANPTNLRQGRLWFPIAASAPPVPLVWDFAMRQDKANILRGIGDFMFINFGGGTVPTSGTVDYEIQIEEDQS